MITGISANGSAARMKGCKKVTDILLSCRGPTRPLHQERRRHLVLRLVRHRLHMLRSKFLTAGAQTIQEKSQLPQIFGADGRLLRLQS